MDTLPPASDGSPDDHPGADHSPAPSEVFRDTVLEPAAAILGISGRLRRYLRYSLPFVYMHWHHRRKPFNWSKTLQSLRAIERAARRLDQLLRKAEHRMALPAANDYSLALLRGRIGFATSPEQLESVLSSDEADDRQVDERIEQFMRSVRSLAVSAGAEADALESRVKKGHGGPRRTPDEALDEILDFLGQIYSEVTEEAPTASASAYAEGGADSRFIRFAKLCLDHLGCQQSTGAIRERWRRVRARRGAMAGPPTKPRSRSKPTKRAP